MEHGVQAVETSPKTGSSISATRRIGIFGGTFDPPHLGHLAVACAARDQLALDEVLLVVAGDPWQKRDRVLAPAALRIELTEVLIAGESRLMVDRREVERTGPSFTIDTVEELLSEAKEPTELVLILGADAAQGIETWHRASDLAALVTLGIAARPGSAPVSLSPRWSTEQLVGLNNPCASTDLRSSRRDVDFLTKCLPEAILLRLSQEGLYAVTNGD